MGLMLRKSAESPDELQEIAKTSQAASSVTKLDEAVAEAVAVKISAESTEAHKRAEEARKHGELQI